MSAPTAKACVLCGATSTNSGARRVALPAVRSVGESAGSSRSIEKQSRDDTEDNLITLCANAIETCIHQEDEWLRVELNHPVVAPSPAMNCGSFSPDLRNFSNAELVSYTKDQASLLQNVSTW